LQKPQKFASFSRNMVKYKEIVGLSSEMEKKGAIPKSQCKTAFDHAAKGRDERVVDLVRHLARISADNDQKELMSN